MGRFQITKGADSDVWLKEKGKWRSCRGLTGKTANISCPECGGVASLSNHEIDEQGIVTPSLVCPYSTYAGCSFHKFVFLEGWSE